MFLNDARAASAGALLLGLGVLSNLAFADEAPGPKPPPLRFSETLVLTAPLPPPATPPVPPPWSGDLSLGYVKTSGNSNTSAFNGKGDLVYKSVDWQNTLSADAFAGRTDGVTTDERYDLGDKLLYNLDPGEYLFTEADYNNDRFGSVPQRYSLSAGYGRHFVKTATQTLDVDLGVGVTHFRNLGDPDYDTRPIGTLGVDYDWKITATSEFKQTLRTEYSGGNVYVNPISQLKLTVAGSLFATLSYELRYNSDVPEGTSHIDQITAINLGYSFGKPKPPCACQ